jgi:glyoxylase-like metal-dependent hydrolase (beta-lactamase superfamily II)
MSTMWRVLRAFALAVGLILMIVIVFLVVSLSGRLAISDGFELNGTRVIKDGIVSVGVLPIGPGEVALIDAGNDRSGKAILAELSRRRLGAESVKAILLTHGHPDHLAAAPLFPDADVMALEPDVALIEGRARARGPVTRLMPMRPTGVKVRRVLHDGDTVLLGQTAVRVFAIPGHTAGSGAFLVNGVLFLGDSADALSDGRVQGATWIFTDDTAGNRQSLARLAARLRQEAPDTNVLAFSHSGVLARGLEPLTTFAGRH